MARTFEQFIRFSTDSMGIERTLRLCQATVQVLSSYTLPFNLLLYALALTADKPPAPDATHAILLALRQRFGLIRRFFRLFRFLDSFHSAHQLLYRHPRPRNPGPSTSTSTSTSTAANPNVSEEKEEKMAPSSSKTEPAAAAAGSGNLRTEEWLDVLGRTFNGMYLLLEASTTAEALDVEGLALWAPATARRLALEAQRFWLLALACGVCAGLLRAVKVLVYTPVPATAGDQFSSSVRLGEGEEEEVREKEAGEGEGDLQREQARLRALASERKEARVLWRRDVQAKVRGLARGVVANALDIALPGSAVGLLDLEPGTVGVAMFVTSILTGLDVWERCGREVVG